MARNQRQYDKEYKIQAIKLAKEIGINKAARELGIAPSTLSHLEQYPQSVAMCWYCLCDRSRMSWLTEQRIR